MALIVISDMRTGLWLVHMDGFNGWNGKHVRHAEHLERAGLRPRSDWRADLNGTKRRQ